MTPPPSEGATEAAAADTARGTLRDGLGGLRNLVQLLHSLRVAPKSIALVLPDVYAALSPMREAKRELLEGLSKSLASDSAVRELEAYFDPRFSELDASINEAMRQTMSARTRLRLEQATTRLSRELDSARSLLDLLTEARMGRKPALDVLEILKQGSTPASSSSPAEPTSVVLLAQDSSHFELAVNPRVLIGLLSLGVELVSAGEELRPLLQVARPEPGKCQISIALPNATSEATEELSLPMLGIIDPTVACMEALAELSDAALSFDANARNFSLSLRGSGSTTN